MSETLAEVAAPQAQIQGHGNSIALDEDEVRSPIHILLVEDDEADAYLIERSLRRNHKVGAITRAHDGEEALRMIVDGAILPDLALIDLQMPRRDGFSFLLEMKKRNLDFASVVLTSSRGGADAHRSFHRGARMFVSKPKEPQRLQAILNEVIRELE